MPPLVHGVLDPEAAHFCREVHPRLVSVLTAQTGERTVAEELAQDALARVCERWDKVRRMEHPVGWTYRVAFNLAASRWRRAAAERRALDRVGGPAVATPDDAQSTVQRIDLRDALARLPQRQRRAVVLRFVGDLSIAETAEALGCKEGTVRSLSAQGVARLRDLLGDQDEDREEVRP